MKRLLIFMLGIAVGQLIMLYIMWRLAQVPVIIGVGSWL